MSDWRPIETAPKDRAVLLWWPHWWHDPHPGYFMHYQWHSDKALTPWYDGNDNGDPGPTHWMPLPEPPKEKPMTDPKTDWERRADLEAEERRMQQITLSDLTAQEFRAALTDPAAPSPDQVSATETDGR